jgi:putative MATE family efflux protein
MQNKKPMNSNPNSRDLTQGPIGIKLFYMSIPMFLAMVSMMLFNIVDTYFIGKLGIEQLAALTFTFPLVMVLNNVALGLGTGLTSLVSKAYGEKNMPRVQQLTTAGIALVFIIVCFVMFTGLLTIDPLFMALGASESLLPYIREYMEIWYWGTPLVVLPMLANSVIRATGDTRTPGLVMMIATVVNVVLDPIFIFGYAFVPAMGIRGAAIATVLARACTFLAGMYILLFRDKLITIRLGGLRGFGKLLKQILNQGMPIVAARTASPVVAAVVTKIIAQAGPAAVAGYGIATRIEFVLLTVIISLATVLAPFAGQNYGAGKLDRVRTAFTMCVRFGILYGLVAWGMMFVCGEWLIGLFIDNVQIMQVAKYYLWIVPLAYGLMGVQIFGVNMLNVLAKPMLSGVITIVYGFGLVIPLSPCWSQIYGVARPVWCFCDCSSGSGYIHL